MTSSACSCSRELIEVLVGPARRRFRLRRQREHHDGDVVDAAADDQRLGNADRDAVDVGADLLVDAQDGVVGVGADEEARRHHDAIVVRLAVDVLDAVDALDDVLERLGHQFDRVRRLEAVGVDQDVDHRHADLRLFLARNGEKRDQADGERRQQEQRRQRRADGRLREPPRQSELHGRTSTSPALQPGEDFKRVRHVRPRQLAPALHRHVDHVVGRPCGRGRNRCRNG